MNETEIVSEGVAGGIVRPLLTIGIPMFNSGARIQTLLNDIRFQVTSGCQLVVLDDDSRDDSLSLAEETLKSFHSLPWTLAKHKSNKGTGVARQSILKFARGAYIWFMDSDDRLPEDAFSVVLRGLANLPPHTILVTALKRRSSLSGSSKYIPGCSDCPPELAPQEAAAALLSGKMTSYLWNKVIPSDALTEERMSTLRRSEDVATLLKLFHSGYATHSTSHSTYIYQVRPDSISQSWEAGQEQFLAGISDIVQLARTLFPQKHFEGPILRFQYRSGFIAALNNAARQGGSPRIITKEARLIRRKIAGDDVAKLWEHRFIAEVLTILLIKYSAFCTGWAFFLKEKIRLWMNKYSAS